MQTSTKCIISQVSAFQLFQAKVFFITGSVSKDRWRCCRATVVKFWLELREDKGDQNIPALYIYTYIYIHVYVINHLLPVLSHPYLCICLKIQQESLLLFFKWIWSFGKQGSLYLDFVTLGLSVRLPCNFANSAMSFACSGPTCSYSSPTYSFADESHTDAHAALNYPK